MTRKSSCCRESQRGRTWGEGPVGADTVEKRRVKCVSFHKHIDKFTVEVAANFAVPCVVRVADFPLRVDIAVSMLFAVKYVLV